MTTIESHSLNWSQLKRKLMNATMQCKDIDKGRAQHSWEVKTNLHVLKNIRLQLITSCTDFRVIVQRTAVYQ